jgi:hypothetical protein
VFNDPFDVTQELRLNFDEASLSSVLAEEMAALIENAHCSSGIRHPLLNAILTMLEGDTSGLRGKIAHGLRDISHPPSGRQISAFEDLKQMWRDLFPTLRVLCLSELNDVTSMWYHYSEEYQGAVLEFEALDEIDSCFLLARPVIYQDDAPAIADAKEWVRCMLGTSTRTYEDLFTEYQYIKTTGWSYENEWRVVSHARPGEKGLFSDYPFDPRELSGIYLGPQCSDQARDDLLGLLTHGLEHARAYRAIGDGLAARFRFEPIS